MARTDLDRAREAVYQLYNVADHVAKCAMNAQAQLEGEGSEEAADRLKDAARSADFFDMRWRDALAALEVLSNTRE